MKFSDRLGVTKPNSIIQIKSMDVSLRNKLWNVVHLFIATELLSIDYNIKYSKYYKYLVGFWHDYFKLPIDRIPESKNEVVSKLRGYFFNCEWYDVYNFLEFILEHFDFIEKEPFLSTINSNLASEIAGYRFVGEKLIPITDESEIKEIDVAILNAFDLKFEGVKIHLKSALSILSNKENPDYRNVIKESVTALEAISQIISGEKNAELGKALLILKKKLDIDESLISGFRSLYGFTCKNGIRHALLEKDNLDVEDARYMLVSCSAFINYLIVKADKAGILKK